ncbi:MAG: hypothetical protein H6835_16240 [Planctomycetes bacterium]|nr:hypothetical protein [Planctomycetota bacterium]
MSRHPSVGRAIGAGVFLLSTVGPLAAQGLMATHGEVLLACGDDVPGVPGAVIYPGFHLLAFDNPTIDLDGTVLFRGGMQSGTGPVDDGNRHAYFLGRSGGDLHIVVRGGEPAPGCPPGTVLGGAVGSVGMSAFPRLSPAGGLLFFQSAIYDPINPANTPASSDTALFWGPPGGVLLLAREGAAVPFAPGTTWSSFLQKVYYTHVCANGQVLFTATLGGAASGSNAVMVTGLPGALQPVLRKGDPYPFGGVVVPVSPFEPLNVLGQLNASGQVLHDIKSSSGELAIGIWTLGVDTLVARDGQQAPGLPAGVVFADDDLAVNSGCFNAAGQTAIVAGLSGAGVTAANDQALYVGGIGGIAPLLRRGDAAPGLPGITWGAVDPATVVIDDDGDLAFVAGLGGAVTTADDSGLWLGQAGDLACIAREGDLVPGLLPSANGPWRFGQFGSGLTVRPYLVRRRALLFQNPVTDGVATRTLMFGYTPARGLILLLDDADTFTTGQGTAAWTIATQFGSPNSSDGTPAWMNANGDFVCKLVLGAPCNGAIVRGHLGSLVGTPSSVPVSGGVTHTLSIDVGPAHGFELYVVLASSLGTRPGFPSPLGPQHVPLVYDPFWTQMSLELANSALWPNSVGVTDQDGVPFGGPAGFTLPPGFPSLLGTTLYHAVVTLDGNLVSTFVSEPSAVLLH